MPYQRSLEIERRLDRVLRLIRKGGYSTPKLAESIGVSIPTISRCVLALRERGHNVRAENHASGWHYVLADDNARLLTPVATHATQNTSQTKCPA